MGSLQRTITGKEEAGPLSTGSRQENTEGMGVISPVRNGNGGLAAEEEDGESGRMKKLQNGPSGDRETALCETESRDGGKTSETRVDGKQKEDGVTEDSED
ncbi:hypothetical protein NDU88_002105 [Pleurodeles waltl]|uniref:Uncharacterized protein n=1 Tax=Pleurodeles waltl TaxID=8319 RepID=A0AAV7P8H7_PLEWA|nr:hypothetical protein NDU88_002105 [Pleurodeles waltl]